MNYRPSFTVTSSIAFAVVLTILPSGAMADCRTWELLPKFSAVQANGFNVVFEVDVADGKVTGGAHYYAGPDFGRMDGDAGGTFDGNVFDVSVFWGNKSYGRYEGHIDSSGHLAGVTKDLQDPEHKGTNPEVYWSSKQTFKCAQAEPPPPASNAESVPKPPRGFDPNPAPAIESVPKPPGGAGNIFKGMKP